MKVYTEAGVLAASERFFSTPSATARRQFLYITRCGHYYLSTEYDFRDTCAVGQEESHRNFFLLYVRRGAMRFISESRTETTATGQCVLMDCRGAHRFLAIEESETIWIHFDGLAAREFFEQILTQNGGHHVLTPTAESHLERTLVQLVAAVRAEKTPWTEVETAKQLYGLLCDLLVPPLSDAHKEDHPVTQAMHYIHAHLFEPLSVEQIAAAVHLSASHFSRQFRTHTGFSPHEYMVLHRIDEAKSLLHGTSLSIKEIAFRVGYHSEVNFIASFKTKTGVSPTAFRRNPV